MKSKIDLYEECIPYFNKFVTKQNNSEEQKQNDLKDHLFYLFGRKKFYYHKHENRILKTSKLPQRIAALYQKGTFKIELERKQDNSMSRRESLERKVGNATERQLALYKQGVAKIRQQIMMSSSQHQEHKNDSTDPPTNIRTKTGISTKEQIKRTRHLSLYELGVKKQRERRNRQEVTELNSQKQEVLGLRKGDSNNYSKRPHRLLHNLVSSKMDRPIPFSEKLSTEIKDSSFSSRHETALNVVTNGIAGVVSTLALDLPEIYDLQKRSPTSLTTPLRKQKKAAINISKLYTMSKKYISDQSSTKSAKNICNDSLHDDAVNADTTNAPPELRLRGLVIQYLQDVVKAEQENRRSKRHQKYSDMEHPEDSEIESAESTRNHIVHDILPEEESSYDDPMNILHDATSKTITMATESFSGGNQQLSTDQVSSCGMSLHEGSVSSGRSCVGCWYVSECTCWDGIVEMMLSEQD